MRLRTSSRHLFQQKTRFNAVFAAMLYHTPANLNAASAAPAPLFSTILGQFAMLPQWTSRISLPATRYRNELTCTKCGHTFDIEKGFYKRKKDNKTHHCGDPIQPCKECTKAKTKRNYRNKVLGAVK